MPQIVGTLNLRSHLFLLRKSHAMSTELLPSLIPWAEGAALIGPILLLGEDLLHPPNCT